MNTNVKIFLSVIGLLIVGLVVTIVLRLGKGGTMPAAPGVYDTFAQCLKTEGATFYGAFWCPHCQAQKKLFGSSVTYLPYVECSTLDASGQTQICIDKKIDTYPTWEFADGSRLTGETPLQTLADKTSCALPEDTGGVSPIVPVPAPGIGTSSPAVK